MPFTPTTIKTATGTVIATRDLSKALGLVQQVIKRRNMSPVLTVAKIAVREGECLVCATSLDEFSQATSDAEGPDLEFTIDPHILAHLLKHGGPTVEFGTAAGKHAPVLTVKTGDMSARINLNIAPDDMPTEGAPEYDEPTSVEAKELLYALDALTPSISTDKMRYYLNGVYMHAGPDDSLRMASTDSHRLTRIDLPGAGWKREGMILPRRTVAKLRKYLRGVDRVDIQASRDRMRFAAPGWSLTAKLIDGTFPNYARAIPDLKNTFDVSLTGDAIAALPSMGWMAVAAHIHPDAGRMWVQSPDIGEVSVPISGKGGLCGIDLRYLRGFCPPGEAVRILGDTQDGGSVNNALIVLGAEERLLRVVMPMAV